MLTPYRGFARRGTHLQAHDFSTSLGFLLYSAVWRKTTKLIIILDSLNNRISKFTQVSVLIYSCHSVVVSYYDVIKVKSSGTVCFISKYQTTGNQHGSLKCDDFQNWLDMTSHESPILSIVLC